MVAIHAALAGIDPPRVTDDGDVVVDVRTFGRRAMRKVAEALVAVDFTASTSPEGVTRFERGRAKIDLLAPEGIGGNATTNPPGLCRASTWHLPGPGPGGCRHHRLGHG